MKKYILPAVLSGICLMTYGQSSDQNYIRTTTYLDEDESGKIETVQYLDGLGKPVQTVQKGITPTGGDLADLIEYDAFGREIVNWSVTPFAGNNGNFISASEVKTGAKTYHGSQTPLLRTGYEASPLNRIVKQTEPGGNVSTEIKYKTNSATDKSLICSYYFINGDNLVKQGNYAENSLTVTEITRDNKKSLEFKDVFGKVLLTRSRLNNGFCDTYYVYDEQSCPRYVLSPVATEKMKSDGTYTPETPSVKQYAYVYRYDERKRCVEKRVPGCDWMYLVYDKADNLVLTQDGEQRKKNEWTFSKYDNRGRVIVTGIHKNASSRATLAALYKEKLCKEEFNGNDISPSGPANGYSAICLPNVDIEWMTVNYYDTYSFLDLTALSTRKTALTYVPEAGYGTKFQNDIVYGGTTYDYSAKEKLSGTRSKLLDKSGREIVTVLYYDDKGRVIQTLSDNHLGGYDKEYTAFNFTGQPVQKKQVHSSTVQQPYTTVYTFDYDHAGRVTETKHQIAKSSSAPLTLSKTYYNELGLLNKKSLFSRVGNSNVQNISYTYDLRNRLTRIESPEFTEFLKYGLRNDNIESTYYKVREGRYFGGYQYEYDGLERLSWTLYEEYPYSASQPGTASSIETDYYTESLTYDSNGNIMILQREGARDEYDDLMDLDYLTYTYEGNQVTRILEDVNADDTNSSNYIHFDDSNKSYFYDACGRLISNGNKGIGTIRYNYLHLPDTIQFVSGNMIVNIYDASGMKRSIKHITSTGTILVPMGETRPLTAAQTRSVLTNDYAGPYEYEDGKINKLFMPDGYADYWASSGWKRIFNLKDHLGNNRVLLHESEGVKQVNHYLPFGLPIGPLSINRGFQQRKYNDKEFDSMYGLNWYNYDSRYYDAVRNQFTTPDPLAEKYYSWSPYAYCFNNPMRFIDPTGMGPDDFVNGVVTGVKNVVKGISNAVENPVQTIKTVKDNITVEDVVCSVLLTPAGNTLLNAGKAVYNDINGGDGSNTGEFVGESAANATLGAGLVLLTDGIVKTANIKIPVKANVVNNSVNSAKGEAAGWQGKGLYPGVDKWRNITLSEGKQVVGGLPGQSNYYTTMSGLQRSGANKTSLFEGLQVAKHPQFGYRNQVGIYNVTRETPAAFGSTYANPQFGAGGLPQIFIPDYSSLQLIKTIPLK